MDKTKGHTSSRISTKAWMIGIAWATILGNGKATLILEVSGIIHKVGGK